MVSIVPTNSAAAPMWPSVSGGSHPQPADMQQVQKTLDETLKNTGFKAEVDTSDPKQVVVRILDSVTGRTVVQIPSATALVIAQAVRDGALEQGQAGPGVLFDQAA